MGAAIFVRGSKRTAISFGSVQRTFAVEQMIADSVQRTFDCRAIKRSCVRRPERSPGLTLPYNTLTGAQYQ